MCIKSRISLQLLLFVMIIGGVMAAEPTFKLKDGDRIVFLGDSITEAGTTPEGYISLFKLFCDVNGIKVNAINAGISGHKSNDMLARLEKDVLDQKPTWVSISCGVNDVWHQFSKASPGVPLPEYKKNMTEIVDRCLKSGAKVVLLTATPIMEKIDNPENVELKKYNTFLRQLAKKKKIVLCDLFTTFENQYKRKLNSDNLLTTDGVHMKPRGNRLMAREFLHSLGATPKQLNEAEQRWELVNN